MSNHEVAAILERNLANAFAQYHKKMRAVVVRALLRFAKEAGLVKFDGRLCLANRIYFGFGSRALNVEDLLPHLVYQKFDKDQCWHTFKQELVNILYYGSQETYESAGVALLILAADLGLLPRLGGTFQDIYYLLHHYISSTTRESIEDDVMQIESRYDQSKRA
jgi:hypothetical protein